MGDAREQQLAQLVAGQVANPSDCVRAADRPGSRYRCRAAAAARLQAAPYTITDV